MIPNTDVTVYNKYTVSRVEKWARFEIPRVVWQHTSAANRSKPGVIASDTAFIMIPFARKGATYLDPIAWQALTDKHGFWTLQEGDYIVRGIVPLNDVIVDGTFDVPADWTPGTGWSITGGQAVASGTPPSSALLAATPPLSVGGEHTIECDVVVTSGSVRVRAGTSTSSAITTSGHKLLTMTATVNGNFGFEAFLFTGTIDNATAVPAASGSLITQLKSTYNEVVQIMSIDPMDEGSPNMQHFELSCK